MNKTVQTNISGFVFHLDEDAYVSLSQYLASIKIKFKNDPGCEEIISDIESRIAEIFKENMGNLREVIHQGDVKKVMEILGMPEDFEEAQASQNTNQSARQDYDDYRGPKRVFRDPDNRSLGGVSSGLAAYLGIDPIIIRILFIVTSIPGGFGALVYVILWAAIPEAKSTADKLMMKGEKVNIDNIEKSIKREFDEVKKKLEEAGNQLPNSPLSKGVQRLGSLIENIFRSVFRLIAGILTAIFKLIGVIVIIAVSIFVFGLIVALFGPGIQLNGISLGPDELNVYLNAIMVSPTQVGLFYTSLGLIIVSVLFSIIGTSLRLILGKKINLSGYNGVVTAAIIIGFVLLFSSGIYTASRFSNESRFTEQQPLANITSDTLSVSSVSNLLLNDYGWNQEFTWIVEGDEQFVNKIQTNIKKSSSSEWSMEIQKKSKGKTKSDARQNAKAIDYQYTITESTVQLNDYLRLPKGQFFRDQKVELILEMPEGKVIYLHENMYDLINNCDMAPNTDYHDLPGNYWLMTDVGLVCMSCKDL